MCFFCLFEKTKKLKTAWRINIRKDVSTTQKGVNNEHPKKDDICKRIKFEWH